MNTLMNTNGIGNPIVGSVNGCAGSGDLWTSNIKNKKKRYKIKRKDKK